MKSKVIDLKDWANQDIAKASKLRYRSDQRIFFLRKANTCLESKNLVGAASYFESAAFYHDDKKENDALLRRAKWLRAIEDNRKQAGR